MEEKKELNISEYEKIENEKEEKSKKKRKGFNMFHFSQEIIDGIKNIGYKNPTPIQKKSNSRNIIRI